MALKRVLRLSDPEMRGSDVDAVEQLLLGLEKLDVDNVDGVFNHRTEEAVKAFQESDGLFVCKRLKRAVVSFAE